VNIDPTLNRQAVGGIQRISSKDSPTAVIVVPAREDQMIAVHVERMARHDTQV
jgi:acetate kinase